LPKACLTALAPASLKVTAVITRPSFTIGRREGNDLILTVDNKIGVSGHHATIKYVDGAFMLVDDKSTFGTFVNERRLAPGTPMALTEGAIIGLGPKVKLKFAMRECP
jgi:pSer/pThr/pTyr-binding forkhead associated (FHA) protein